MGETNDELWVGNAQYFVSAQIQNRPMNNFLFDLNAPVHTVTRQTINACTFIFSILVFSIFFIGWGVMSSS